MGFVTNIYVFFPLYVLTIELTVVKFCHSISVKCSPYRDTEATDPSAVKTYYPLIVLVNLTFFSIKHILYLGQKKHLLCDVGDF